MLVFAHRGASGEFPENSQLAFEQAIKQQSDGIELDVQYHHSDELLVMHDRYLELSSGKKTFFNALTVKDIQSLTRPKQQIIPTLSQALQTINGRCLVNIELKSADDCHRTLTKLTKKLYLDLNHAFQTCNLRLEQIIISSFNHSLLAAVQSFFPNVKTAALIACLPKPIDYFIEQLRINAVNPCIDCLNKTFVEQAHKHNLQVFVYTVDHPTDIQNCLDWGVDGIFTNYPHQTKNTISQLLQANN